MMTEIVKKASGFDIPRYGLISPGKYQDGKKVAIEVFDLVSGETRILANLNMFVSVERTAKKWLMHDEVFRWGNQQLKKVTNKKRKVFFLDEIGIYEMLENNGWQEGLRILKQGKYKQAVVSVRKNLSDEIVRTCGKAKKSMRIIYLDDSVGPKERFVDEIVADLVKNVEK